VTVFAAPTIAHLLKLDSRLPINGMVLSTFLMPVTLYLFGEALEGDGLGISISQYGSRVAIFLLLPLFLSILINRFVGKLPKTYTPTIFLVLRAGAVASLLAFGIGIMDGVAEKIETDPDRVLIFLSIALGFVLATVVGTIALFWSMGRDLTIAATILSAHRNVGLTYALIGTAAGHDFAIYVAVSQVPMFLSPLLIHLIQVLRPSDADPPDQLVADLPQA
jgi:BASS family bile acid:Na+ symporter